MEPPEVMMMPLGDSHFLRVQSDANYLITQHGVQVSVTRINQVDVKQRDIFGQPENYTPQPFNTRVLITGQELNELEIIAGGKPKEALYFIAASETIKENDDILYNSNTYQVTNVSQPHLGGSSPYVLCKAEREVHA